jgi:Lrp/AsnC family transcriptional regulator, leucine-responsive regulatory protein
MNNLPKLDAKDYKILKELDKNYRISFSKIAKKVRLSKNSVALRFEKKLKPFIAHSTVGIDNELLGYKIVKVFYTLDYYDDKTEKALIKELKKHKNILWVARFYGHFDISICLLVKDLNELVTHITQFNEKFSKQIRDKEIQIISKQLFFRHGYLYGDTANPNTEVTQTNKRYLLSKIEKKILSIIRNTPRISIIDISKKTKISPKTISSTLKKLEKNRVITGYYMTLDNNKFNLNTFKFLVQIQDAKYTEEFEKYLLSLGNIRHYRKMLGLWDYEIDLVYNNMEELHEQVDIIKQKFPGIFKRTSFVSFGKRIVTNRESFLD